MGTPRRAGPPDGLPAQAVAKGVNFGRRSTPRPSLQILRPSCRPHIDSNPFTGHVRKPASRGFVVVFGAPLRGHRDDGFETIGHLRTLLGNFLGFVPTSSVGGMPLHQVHRCDSAKEYQSHRRDVPLASSGSRRTKFIGDRASPRAEPTELAGATSRSVTRSSVDSTDHEGSFASSEPRSGACLRAVIATTTLI
jgi:hypothetical protein